MKFTVLNFHCDLIQSNSDKWYFPVIAQSRITERLAHGIAWLTEAAVLFVLLQNLQANKTSVNLTKLRLHH